MIDQGFRDLIPEALSVINAIAGQPFVLKGGTALMECYELDRVSIDIDLDGEGAYSSTLQPALEERIEEYCQGNGFTLRIGKNTETVQKLYIHRSLEQGEPLKIEVSYRRQTINPSDAVIIAGYKVYTLDVLTQMKASAYLSRDRIRDLFDLVFVCEKYFDQLTEQTKSVLVNAFEYKDLSQFDYLIRTQDDPLIDKDLLAIRFLNTLTKLGLLAAT
ncbi:MAG: nucleotidyl transferase AbiEii/AbiGii toxin family protein [Coriobacteriia bacterium]|nr:nucleotidyl transferase AbiEii/AbiGii toxin family protein [Coriobacteriia bacterium]